MSEGKPAQRNYRTEALVILADGQWYTTAQLLGRLQGSFPRMDMAVARNVVASLQRRTPQGKEFLSKKIGRRCQYRLRDALLAARSVPTQLVTSLVEGVAPIIEELKQWGRQGEYEMSPSAIRMVAARLEKLFAPLQQSLSS